jgi:hypothetical protein
MSRREWLGAGLFYLVLAVVWAAPSSLSPWDTLPDLGDPLHLGYVMAWDAHQLVRQPWALYDTNSFYPYARSLAFGDHLLPEALMVAPVNWLTGNAVLASNVGVVLGLWLSGLSMFALVRRSTGSWGAGLVSGVLYAFNSFTRHELLRVHVLHLEWWPLSLLFLGRFVEQGRGRDARLLAVTLALQGLSGAYYLVCTALLAPLWLAAAYLLARRAPARREWATLAASLALVALPAVLVLWPYVIQLREMGFEKGLVEGADLACYLEPPPQSWLWGRVHLFAGCFGLPHFLGFVSACLMAAGAWWLIRRPRAGEPPAAARILGGIAAWTAGVGLLLSLGPLVRVGGLALGSGPFRVLYALVPLVRGMDGSKRLSVLVWLGGSLLAGLGVARLLGALPSRLRPWAVAALVVGVPAEHWTPPPAGAAVPTGRQVPAVYRWLAEDSKEPLVELPLHLDVVKRYWSSYLYFSTYHWRPIPIGRTSFYPPAHDYLAWSLRGFPDDVSLLLLERLGIRTIVVHPLGWPAGERERRLAALDQEPRLQQVRHFDDVLPERYRELGLGAERVYRIVGSAPQRAPLCSPGDEIPRDGWQLRTLHMRRGFVPPAEGAPPARSAQWTRAREWRTPWISEWIRDGDRRTAWLTVDAQRPGDGLEVLLPGSQTVAAVALELAYPYDEFPRGLVIAGGGDERRRLPYADGPEERWETLESLLRQPRQARMVLRLSPEPVSDLVLRIGGAEAEAAWPRWSIPELHLYRECR